MLLLAYFILSQKNKPSSGNPIVQGWYADPEAAVFENKFRVYPTFSAKFEEQVFLDAFSSEDMLTWVKHPHIIDTSAVKWAHKAIWAPSIVKKDSNYFLFFSANDIQAPFRKDYIAEDNKIGGIGIGISSKPEGPYKDYLGKPLIQEFTMMHNPSTSLYLKTLTDNIISFMEDEDIVTLPT